MEENYEIIERGLLSEVNGESDIIDIIETNPQGPVAERKMSGPVRKVNAKILNYLGIVKVTTSFKTRNAKAWLLQSLLNELGYSLNPDGFFGQLTEEQVKKYQAANGLVADGIVGPATWSELIYQAQHRISNSKITDQDYKDAAAKLGVEVAVVKAIKDVEAGGAGYVFSNHPTILFESHVFWKELKKRGVTPSKYNDRDILNQTWKQGKDYYVGGVGEYARLEKACLINRDAAEASASWGLFQIMGNNYKACGCRTVSDFVTRMKRSEREQLMLFVAFIKNNNLVGYLQKKDWAGFAYHYNGPSYKDNLYDVKLQNAYNKYK
jgi:peptidoglycan hydrolase-like protein with peptidoglycan-binding domain